MSGSTPKDVDSSSKGDADDAPATATVASTGWAYVGSDRHPAVVLDVKQDAKLFIITGTSNPGLTGALGGAPVIVQRAEGLLFGWPGTTHFYPRSTTTVTALQTDSGRRCPPLLFSRLRKLVGYPS